MTITLRPYQQQLVQGIYGAWNSGARNVCAVAPTGAGKSVIMSQIVMERNATGAKQCVIAHRNELVGQMSLHIARRGIKHRIIGSRSTVAQIIAEHRRELNGRSFVNPDANCTVASVQTLTSRMDSLVQWAQQIDDWTIDEFHHCAGGNQWMKAAAMFPNARGLGVTATPMRADGLGLGRHHDGIADALIIGPSMRELIDGGSLSDYEIVCPQSDLVVDDEDFAPSGDLSPKKGRLASQRSHIVGDVVQEYLKYAAGERGICFATDVETAGEMAQRFNDAGVAAAALSAKTPFDVRGEMIRRFRDGRLSILVNVDLFSEGFDCPVASVVIMARPTASLGVYLQQAGRALRPAPGKARGLIIDHVSNWKRHGLPDKPRQWTLDRRDKRAKRAPDPEDIPLTACRECSRPYERALPACPYCGAVPPLPDPASRTLEQVDGDLLLLDREMLARMRAAVQLEAPGSVAERVAMAAGDIAGRGAANRQMERHTAQARLRGAIEQWGGIQRHIGRSDQEAYRRFYIALGVDVLTALTLPRADMERLAQTIEGWCGIVPQQEQAA